MRFEVQIACDNAAFDEPGVEVTRILRSLASQVQCTDLLRKQEAWERPLFDYNGNRVGYAGFREEESDDTEDSRGDRDSKGG